MTSFTLSGCTSTKGHSSDSLKNWPANHWKSQNFEPLIQGQDEILRTAVDQSDSMFASVESLSPEDFIANLKKARIVKNIRNERSGFFKQTISPDVAIILDHNFYTLSYPDQVVITELLAKSFDQENYILRDGATKQIVGQITPEGFHLY